jgi:TPR repeat protein
VAAYKEISKELKKFLMEAEKGDSKTQYDIGLMYQNGIGVSLDHKEAAEWFRRSAEQDDFAQFFVNVLLYDVGMDKTQDFEEKAKQFRLLAEIGLGGKNMTPAEGNITTEKWMRLAAEHGNLYAQGNLGFMYQEDLEGVPQNYAEAVRWLKIAGERGDI